MNSGAVQPSVLTQLSPTGGSQITGPLSGEGWSRRKFYFVVFLAVLAHIALIFIFGARKPIVPRALGRVPQLQIADAANELVALSDPTLLVLPHVNDFASAAWLKVPAMALPSFDYTEPPQFLPLPAEKLGATFTAYMQSNRLAEYQFNFKPEPSLAGAELVFQPALPSRSTFHVAGELASRTMLNRIAVPSLPLNDVLRPSRVQVLVDAAGNVVSTVLLDSCENATADQQALKLAHAVRFAPAERLMLGELIFRWRTVTLNTP